MIEIHLHAPEALRRQRDSSGAHATVARGDVDGDELLGIAVGYEEPTDPDLVFDTSQTEVAPSVDAVVGLLRERGVLAVGS